MSGNFAIKGGGRTPNGKCHLKFPFWFFDSFPNFHQFLLHFFSFTIEMQFVFWGSCPLLESSTFRRRHPFCLSSTNLTPDLHFAKILTTMQDFWARIHPKNSVILTSLASLWSLSASTFSKFSFVWVTRLTGFPILQNVSSIFKLEEQRRGKKTFDIKWEPRNIWKIQWIKNLFPWWLSDLDKNDKIK